MNVSPARKFALRQNVLSGVAESAVMAIPVLVALAVLMSIPASAAAGQPDDITAYQSAQYGQPMPPAPPYPGPPAPYVPRNQLQAQLNYAEAQYNQARQAGNQGAAKHWRKEIKHLRRQLYGNGHAEAPGYGAPAYMPPQGPYYPPASAYAPPTQEYGAPGPGYAEPYFPSTPTYGGYAGAPPAPYPGAGYPPAGYPNPAAASPYGAPGASGSMGGLTSLLGPLLGGGSAAPAAAPYPTAGYPQAGYPNAAAGYPNAAPAAAGSMGGIGSLLGPLLRGGSIR